ncbi:hypothetical protein KI387_005785 [Taxus chinensis]|uniref:Protein kinase domain-containing protein n=1 Tax=Taxus chinensis TaxID=29808 RepID=A0AA38GP38_TAXCH|nr:hypothetical protein KI387_005785 [Taxus chinensis]
MDSWVLGLVGAGSVIAMALLLLLVIHISLLLAKHLLSTSETRAAKLENGLTGELNCIFIIYSYIRIRRQPDYGENRHSYLRGFYPFYVLWVSADRKAFTLKAVQKYSEGFSNKVGEGTTNAVFKGILPDAMEVAIKVPKNDVAHSSDVEARSRFQLELLSRIRHQHLVNLIGYCEDGGCRILVFQYASNGTLFENLHVCTGYERLTWKQRMRIITGIAYGLSYLHHSCDPPVIHGDLRSCNILLTEDYAAKINGIGKVPIVASSELALVRRTGASVDPEIVCKGVYSRAGDVYSFGILLLEIVSGRLPFSEQTGLLVEWAGKILPKKEQTVALIDPALNNVVHAELCSVCEVAHLCIQRESSSRPVMRDVVDMLTKDLKIVTEMAAPANSPVTLRGLLEIL